MKGSIELTNLNNTIALNNSNWFRYWFDSAYYRRLYGNRNEKEAAEFIDNLTDELSPSTRAEFLDLGCGFGRHSRHLASKGFKVTGIDLSPNSIREAKKSETDRLHFYKHDMRFPFGTESFDYILNFFTSFGYFTKPHENFQVIGNISDALKPGGTLVMDYLNIHHVQSNLVKSEHREIDGVIYKIDRWSDENFFYKKIFIEGEQRNNPIEFTEQVAKFSLYDFEYMFSRYKLRMEKIYGDYNLNRFDRNLSPRLIIKAKRI
jgi:SAM-dependent methyltransferase